MRNGGQPEMDEYWTSITGLLVFAACTLVRLCLVLFAKCICLSAKKRTNDGARKRKFGLRNCALGRRWQMNFFEVLFWFLFFTSASFSPLHVFGYWNRRAVCLLRVLSLLLALVWLSISKRSSENKWKDCAREIAPKISQIQLMEKL